jgi:hypothetical protein
LLPDGVRLRQPLSKLCVDVLGLLESEHVHMIPRRKGLDAAKSGTLAAPREHEVSIEPRAPRGHLRERHADVKRDAGLLGQYLYRSDGVNGIHDCVEELADRRWLSREVMVEVVAAARVRLVAVRELAAALLAAPQRAAAQGVAREDSILR